MGRAGKGNDEPVAVMLRHILYIWRSFAIGDSSNRPGGLVLSFPNPSRDFVASKNWVHFTGYDSVKEISFFLEMDALLKLRPQLINTESAILQAFDDARQRIHEVASQVYASRPNDSFAYHLGPGDF